MQTLFIINVHVEKISGHSLFALFISKNIDSVKQRKDRQKDALIFLKTGGCICEMQIAIIGDSPTGIL